MSGRIDYQVEKYSFGAAEKSQGSRTSGQTLPQNTAS